MIKNIFSYILCFICQFLFFQNFIFGQNVGIGTNNPVFKLDVREGSINTDSVYRIDSITVVAVPGAGNLFLGKNAGRINTGINNTFSGNQAGYANTTGYENSFFGHNSGVSNSSGYYNSFFGQNNGIYNTSGHNNSFFGQYSGYFNNTGFGNSFFGQGTGLSNTLGFENSLFGQSAGFSNNTGNANSFFGKNAGFDNTTGSNNTAIGFNADVSETLTNATALGANSVVTASNAIVLGGTGNDAVNVGIGTTNPSARLQVNGTLKLADGTQGAGKILTSDAAGLASWQPPPPPPQMNYPMVSICCQSWMVKNLDVSVYKNGDTIPHVNDPSEWASLNTGAYCYYNNDSTTYGSTYGKLYNWYAVNDPRGLAPEGWHIPTAFEWTTLGNCLGGNEIAGGPMKESGTSHWTSPNTGANNLSGFTGLPGGLRDEIGTFSLFGNAGLWWCAIEFDTESAWFRNVGYNNTILSGFEIIKRIGFSVRCIKN